MTTKILMYLSGLFLILVIVASIAGGIYKYKFEKQEEATAKVQMLLDLANTKIAEQNYAIEEWVRKAQEVQQRVNEAKNRTTEVRDTTDAKVREILVSNPNIKPNNELNYIIFEVSK